MTTTDSTSVAASTCARLRGRLQLIALAVLFAAPMIAAFLYRPSASVHYGTLIEPPRMLSSVTLSTLDGEPVALETLFEKWNIVYFDAGQCDTTCEDALYGVRQARAAQGRHADRVRGVMVVTGEDADLSRLHTIEDAFGGRVLIGDSAAVEQLVAAFGVDPATPRIFVVDPLGNLMMSYPADADPNGIRKDLSRLLRVSQVG